VLDGGKLPQWKGTQQPPLSRFTDIGMRPLSVVTKRFDGSGCHLVRRKASAQATLCGNFGGVNSIGADPSTTLWGSTEMVKSHPEGPNSKKSGEMSVSCLRDVPLATS